MLQMERLKIFGFQFMGTLTGLARKVASSGLLSEEDAENAMNKANEEKTTLRNKVWSNSD